MATERQKDWDCLIVDHPIDLFYLTGHTLSKGRLCLAKQEQKLFVDGRYVEEVGGFLASDEAILEFLRPYKRIAFDSETTSYLQFLELKALLAKAGKEPLAVVAPIKERRAVKRPDEILALRRAAGLGLEGANYVESLLQEGVQEQEVAKALKIFWLEKGAEGFAFEPIIAFGANSALPHHRADGSCLKRNDIALVDIGVKLNHYHSDLTKTFFIGSAPPRLQEIYRIVEEMQQEALMLCKEGAPIVKLTEKVESIAKAYGCESYLRHGLGHGIGLQIHELPSLKAKEGMLRTNMTITIEPGLYVPGLGGVRLEKAIVITQTGYEDLTNDLFTIMF